MTLRSTSIKAFYALRNYNGLNLVMIISYSRQFYVDLYSIIHLQMLKKHFSEIAFICSIPIMEA